MPLSAADRVEIGKRLADIRAQRQQTQADMAADIGVDRSYLGQLEIGRTTVSIGKLFALATKLNVDRDWLVFGDPVDSPAEVRARRVANYLEEIDNRLDDANAGAERRGAELAELEQLAASLDERQSAAVSAAIRRAWVLAQDKTFKESVQHQASTLGMDEVEIADALISRLLALGK